MAQAKTLNKTELKQLLEVTNSCSRYPVRDSTMLLFTHLCGLRVGEVAALRSLLHSIYNVCMHVLELLALRHTVEDVLG